MSLILYLVVYQYQLHIEYIAQAGYHTVGASIRMSWRRGFIIMLLLRAILPYLSIACVVTIICMNINMNMFLLAIRRESTTILNGYK